MTRVYVDSPIDAPKDEKVQRGPKGGYFYEPSSDADDIDLDDFFNLSMSTEPTEFEQRAKKLSEPMQTYINTTIANEVSRKRIFDIHEYTSNGYSNINGYLKYISYNIKSTKLESCVDNISEFLKGAPKTQGTVYRGMGYAKDIVGTDKFNSFLKNVHDNEKIVLSTFTSASLDPNVAGRFTKKHSGMHTVLLEIESKNGVFLNGGSVHPDEYEVLFDHHTEFLIKRVYNENDTVKIVLEEI